MAAWESNCRFLHFRWSVGMTELFSADRELFVWRTQRLLAEFDEGGALAAFVLGGFGNRGYVGMRFEKVADAAAKNAGAMAMNDAHAREAGEEGAVQILFQLFGGFIDGAA